MATPIPTNQCEFTLPDVVESTGGTLIRAASTASHDRIRGVSIDTRTIEAGSLFVALRGALSDGHGYLQQAGARGAVAAIVETGRRHPALDCIEVHDTLDALGQLARRHLARMRAVHGLPLIAIGEQSARPQPKNSPRPPRVRFSIPVPTPGNLNNLIGVPMTILTLTDDHQARRCSNAAPTRAVKFQSLRKSSSRTSRWSSTSTLNTAKVSARSRISPTRKLHCFQLPGSAQSRRLTNRWYWSAFLHICAELPLANRSTPACDSSVAPSGHARVSASSSIAPWWPQATTLSSKPRSRCWGRRSRSQLRRRHRRCRCDASAATRGARACGDCGRAR